MSTVATAAMLHALLGVVLAALVHQDAGHRGYDRPLVPAIGVFVGGIVGAALYYRFRERFGTLPDGHTHPPVRDHLLDLLRGGVVIAAAFACAVLTVNLGTSALSAAGIVTRGDLEFRVVASALQFLGFGAGVGGYLFLSREWALVRVSLPSLRHVGLIAVGVVALVLAQLALARLLTVAGVEVAQNQVIETGQQDPRYFLYMIPVTLLFVGPFEELVFRGGVQGLLRRSWGPSAAIAVASVLFGLVHWIALVGSSGSRLPYVTVAALLGLVLGILYERSGNLTVPAVAHGLYNTVLFGAQYAEAAGLV
jgi:membrane protease YdiL (CAAX protease family)